MLAVYLKPTEWHIGGLAKMPSGWFGLVLSEENTDPESLWQGYHVLMTPGDPSFFSPEEVTDRQNIEVLKLTRRYLNRNAQLLFRRNQ